MALSRKRATDSQAAGKQSMADIDQIQQHLINLGLPESPRLWLVELWNLTQVLDDAMDGDRADPAAVSRATWAVFQNMPLNDFYRHYVAILQPVLVLQLLKWEACNKIEADKGHNALTYAWRAGFYEVVLMVCHLCGLDGKGPEVAAMYGETLDAYLGEAA